jgi:cytochrome c553
VNRAQRSLHAAHLARIGAVLAFMCVAAPSAVAAPRGDALVGKEKADSERCIECHSSDPRLSGPDNGTGGKFAKLTGQAPDYLVKQIRNFRSGERRHDFMAMMARSIDDADAADIAAYFASLPVMRGAASGDASLAPRLYLHGDPARGIVACVECHGAAGKGGKTPGGPNSPVIGGQDQRYLEKQLIEWRSGERRNSPDGAMNRVTKALTDDEIRALANYLAGL